jgi:hypothetical protein
VKVPAKRHTHPEFTRLNRFRRNVGGRRSVWKLKEPWTVYKTTLPIITVTLLAAASVGWGQSQPPAPAAGQLNLQVLAEALRTAATFHDLVKNLDVEKNLKLSDAPAGSAQSLNRTAAIMGAGAGAGAAVGELKGGQKAILIGAVAGAVGALVIDQVMRHQAAKAELQDVPEPRNLETRPRSPVQELPSQK